MKKHITAVLMFIAMIAVSTTSRADDVEISEDGTTQIVTLLPTKAKGAWPCMYYYLNSNDELNDIKTDLWAKRCVDESEWTPGIGPFSNSDDQFLTTPWGSDRLPLLVRRHFQLSADDISNLSKCTFYLTCSYDENPKIYLNGTLVWQATGWNDNDYSQATIPSRLKTRLLREGDNVLAVSLTAGAGGGHIDYGLTMTKPYTPTGIDDINVNENANVNDDAIYDLSGRKIADNSAFFSSKASEARIRIKQCALPNGVYIYNGKKYIIK